MPKQINVNLAFTADTAQAKRQIAELQKSLDNLLSGSIKENAIGGFDAKIMAAQQSVLKLKTVLDSSLNVDTGRLDLSKFNAQLSNSGLSINKLSSDMSLMGADGRKAFLNLTNSIVTAQKPMIETNKLLGGMWTALKNTARWQLSSSLLHGFIGAIQGAYGYAQDLNKSLTDIAIVTGRSTDQMAAFAEQANKSAQALSVSTTAYTDAALIYYQQGLDDAAVKARTDVTMMLSNVTGQSAEEVSSYMTAIWNNFDDGSKSLEYYADVITALGAATASSSREIASGMQQFAAVAETVGLSYEYAATALATVVAQTRQSESTVGNSFRTIFSRMQGLKLGETLEDGTDLNKYSKALMSIGVSIKDQNGELKEMDTILDEVGEKWQTLSKDQQVALAQTVGGVRQYTNLIALFDNWDKFQKNLDVARGSEGTLEEQQETYAQSWEAASKRVRAAWQAIYQDLIDDKFFISILNGFEKVLQSIDWFIDSIGGLKSVLFGVGAILTSVFGDKLTASIQNAQIQLSKVLKPMGSDYTYAELEHQRTVDKALEEQIRIREQGAGPDQDLVLDNLRQQQQWNKDLVTLKKQVSAEDLKSLESLMKISNEYANQIDILREQSKILALNEREAELKIRERINANIPKDEREAYNKFISNLDVSNVAAAGNDVQRKSAMMDILETEEMEEFKAATKSTNDELLNLIDTKAKLIEMNNNTLAAENATKESQAVANARKEYLELKNAKDKSADADDFAIKKAEEFTVATENEIKALKEKAAALKEAEKSDILTPQAVGTKKWAIRNHEAQIEEWERQKAELQKEYDETPGTEASVNAAIAKEIDTLTQNIANSKEKIQKWNSEIEASEKIIEGEAEGTSGHLEKIIKQKEEILEKDRERIANNIKGTPEPKEPEESENKKPWWLDPNNAAGIGKAAQGLTRLTMGLNTVKSAWDTIKNPDATGWQKFSSVMMAIGMGLPAIGTGIKTLGIGFGMITKGMDAAKISAMEFKAAFWELYVPVIAIGVAIAGAVWAIKALSDEYNKDAIAAEKAAKKAKESKDAYNEAKQAFEELKSSLEDHKKAVDALNDLKVGTEEWKEQVHQLNQEVLDLIEKYPELAKYVKNENGVLKLSEQGMQEYTALQHDELLEKYKTSLDDNIEAHQTDRDSKITDLSRSTNLYGNGGMAASRNATREEINAAIDAYLKTDGAAWGNEEELAKALEKAGYDNENLAKALWENKDSFITLAREVQNNTTADQAAYDVFYQMAVEDQVGDKLRNALEHRLGDDGEALVGPVEELMAAEAKQLVDNGTSVKDALLQIQQDFTENSKQYINKAIEQQKQEIAQKLTDSYDNFGGNVQYAEYAVQDWDQKTRNIAAEMNPKDYATWDDFLNALQEKVDAHEIDINVNTEDLTQFKGKLEDLEAEHATLSKFIQDNWKDYKDLSEHLEECSEAADAVAWSMMRFDDAMQDVSKNYKDWKKALDSKDIVQVNKAVQELKKTYGNLLDIDGSQLSDGFLESSKNLDLMNQVLTGTEEEAIAAYNELEKLAFLDLAAQINPEIDVSAFEEAYDNIKYWTDQMHLVVGDDFVAGDINYEGLTQSLNNMLGQMLMTKEQAQRLMEAMGYRGELELVPVNNTDIDQKQDINANIDTKTEQVNGYSQSTNGDDGISMTADPPVDVTAASITYSTGGIASAVKQMANTVSSLRWQVKDGSTVHYIGGGAPKIKNSPARNMSNKGSGSGGCFAAGTLITLQNQYKNIEDIQVGDIVLSYNEKTKKNVFNKVLQRMVHIVKEKIYSLFIKDEELTVTGIHRFLITRNDKQEWIQASELQEGDLVLLADGTLQEISDINIEEKPLTVYNFEVSNTHNYYVGENQILAHNKGKKGGGGSGKKAKKEKPKEKKKNIKEEDRYHNIKEQIDDLNKSMDRLNKNKDRAYGKDRIKYMQDEINKTKEQIKLTKDYINEINKYRKVDRANLDKVLGKGWKDLNTGKLVGGLNLKDDELKDLFDADGVLKDYEKLFNTIQDRFDQTVTKKHNQAVEEYNKAVAKFNKDQDQDTFDKAKEKMEAAEEEYQKQNDIYKQQLEYLKQYEETMNLWQEQQQVRIDQMNELLDKELELTQHKIELRLEVADDEKSKLEWLYDNLGDSADRVADRIANLGQQARVANKNIDTYLHALATELDDIKDWKGYTKAGTEVSLKKLIEAGELDYDINDPDSILNAFQKINNYITQDWIGAELPMEKILEDFAKYRDGLMDEYSNLKEIADTVEEQLIGAFEEWNEKLDDNLSLFDHYDTVIDTYKEIADLLGSDALGFDPDLDMSYQRAKLSNQQQAARFAKDAYDEAINERIKAQERLANATSDIERKAAEEYLKLCEETERERQEEFLARTRDALRQAQELFEKTLENNQKAYLKSLGGGTPNLGILQNQLDMNKELNDLYLDDYEKYKKLGDLQNNINKQLAKNPNVKVQGKLNDLLDDVNSKMAAGAEISEGEATILEKRLQLLQAEDQLMAARNAKSAVRMTRDNEGNFSYTYTADTSKIEEAQQNYADKFYDLLDYEKQYSQEVQDNILQAMQDFNDKAAEIMEDNTLSQAEKEYLLQQLEDQCKMKVKFYTDQMQIITDEMTRFKNDDWADMEQTLGRMLASDSDFETNFNETTLGKIAPAWNEAKDAMVDFVGAADTLVDNSIGAMNKLLIDNETTMKLVDSSTEAFAENYTGLLQDVVDKSVAAAEAGESLIQTMSDSLNEVLDETKAYYEEYGKELDDLFERINKVTNVINQFRAKWNGEATYEVKTTDTGREGANPSTVSMSNPSEGVNNPTDRFTSTFAGQPVITSVSGTTLPNSTSAELVGDNSEWLNNVIDKAMIKYDSLLSMNKSQTVAGNNNVVINADFPNVESYEEIAKAFETLINSASQYANENNG